MIVAVKTNSKKRALIKLLSIGAVIVMFTAYYFHMSDEYANQEKLESQEKLEQLKLEEEKQKSKKLERIIYREIETAVDLIGQRKVIDVKLISNRVLIVVDPDTNLDALKVRYGSAALIKKGLKDTKIAIDLKYVIESKYNAN
ncbi:hypothetical protein [Halarcobacter anaerophilus]|uniref:Uncharacterized protein n=1 Tax=Halarcobacter anaerophilus TaxID=877500 RepID=A0A4Q0XZT5_9BACT|nr:hypothetical protein [Halarcobacter anaerophilus]QDF30118.1 hypothetical protein AANAER_2672 [Halarcobacter anaerophilus]RXJ63162.1 hypothetical protein CRV06_07835 [Halarcobacter anaerophilus]